MQKSPSQKITSKVLTNKGLVGIEEIRDGDVVIALENGEKVENIVEEVEKIKTTRSHYIINGKVQIFAEQSIFANGNITHARLLKVGDWLMTESGRRTKVKTIEKVAGVNYFYRFTVSGNHGYFINGVLMHNASRFWVLGTGTWDASDTTHWSGSTGGAGGSSVPGSSDSVTLDGASGGGTITVNVSYSITSLTTGAFTGTLDFSANNNSPTMTTFNADGSGTQTLNMGTGTFTMTGNAGSVFTANNANLTLNAGTSLVKLTYSGSVGTRTLRTTTNKRLYDIQVTGGTDTLAIGNLFAHSLDTSGFSGAETHNSGWNLNGNWTLSATQTITTSSSELTYSGTGSVTPNGVAINMKFTVSGSSITVTLKGDFVCDNILKVTQGTFDASDSGANHGVKFLQFSSTNSNVRGITMGDGTWEITGSGAIWDVTVATNFTVTRGASTIKITDSTNTASTFTGGSKTYANIWWARGASTATNTITGTNTFENFKDDGSIAHTIVFPNVTTTVSTFTVNGSAGQLITLSRTGASGTFTLACPTTTTISCVYLSISNSVVSPLSGWFAGLNSVDGGGNTGWVFNPKEATKFFALI